MRNFFRIALVVVCALVTKTNSGQALSDDYEKLTLSQIDRIDKFLENLPTWSSRDTVYINNSKNWIWYYHYGDTANIITGRAGGKTVTYLEFKTFSASKDSTWLLAEISDYVTEINEKNFSLIKTVISDASVNLYLDSYPELAAYMFADFKNKTKEFADLFFSGRIISKKIQSVASFYHFNHKELAATGNYVNGKKEGEWTFYYPESKKFAIDYDLSEYKKFDNLSARIKAAGNFRMGQKEGPWKEIVFMPEKEYNDGLTVLLGEHFYYEFNKLVANGNYLNDARQGNWDFINENNKKVAAGKFVNGRMSQQWIYFNLNNQKPAVIVDYDTQGLADSILIYSHQFAKGDYGDEDISGTFAPVFLKGEFIAKTIYEDLSYSTKKLFFKEEKGEYYIEKIGEEIFYDAFNKVIKIVGNNEAVKVTKTIRLVLPKVNGKDYDNSEISPNKRYFCGVTSTFVELWDLSQNQLVASYEHKIADKIGNLEEVSDQGTSLTVFAGDKYYILNTLEKTFEVITDYNGGSSGNVYFMDKKENNRTDIIALKQYVKGKNRIIEIPVSSLDGKVALSKLVTYAFAYSQTCNRVALCDDKNIFVYDLKNKKVLYSLAYTVDMEISKLHFVDSINLFYYSSPNLVKLNMKTGEVSYINKNASCLEWLGVDRYDACLYAEVAPDAWEEEVYGLKINLKNGVLEKHERSKFTNEIIPAIMKVKGRFRCTQLIDGPAMKYKDSVEINNPLSKYLNNEFNYVLKGKRGLRDKCLVLINDRKEVLLYNPYKALYHEKMVNLSVLNDGNYIFYSPDQYYMASRNASAVLRFERDLKQFSFEQFDLKYNRPDIILDRLGYSDSLTIKIYHQAYLKRLSRMGFNENMLKDDFHLPTVQIDNFKSLAPITDTSEIEFDLNLTDTIHRLDRINIFINDVPLYGSAGIDLRKLNAHQFERKLKITLAEGENKIQVSVLNQAGAESYKETIYITYNPRRITKPNLYLVTIGDSKYKDARFDLSYAAKDAEDTKLAFEGNATYGKVFTYTYTNEKVTKENILKLKEELKKAKRDDVVIITVAGHGVLDSDFNYYLATYDMDFNNPKEKGLPYEELESLVDGIAPLKKVIFLDACHSGEVDKEEVELMAMNTSKTEGIKFRSAGAGIQKKNLGLKTTSELMGELFTDLRRGTGATVISSAGGAEYAMESDQWKNGLFTYCLLHGLKDKAADTNKDGQVMLSELQNYLRTEVTKLSNGAQQPTSRIENLSLDFRVW